MSTFDKLKAAQDSAASEHNDKIARVLQAYKTGALSDSQKADFEHDVSKGLIMLPKGESLGGEIKKEPLLLPVALTEAYVGNKLTQEQRADLEHDIAKGLVRLPALASNRIPTVDPAYQTAGGEQGLIERAPEPSPTLGERVRGAGETALNVGTGATTGALGMANAFGAAVARAILDGSFGTKQAADLIERKAAEGAQQLTYQPATETGQRYAQAAGHAMGTIVPALPLTAELGMIGRAVGSASPSIGAVASATPAALRQGVAAAGEVLQAVKPAVAQGVESVKAGAQKTLSAITPARFTTERPTAGTAASGGAAGTDIATMRRANAAELGFEGDAALTEGQATWDHGAQSFEKETAKSPEHGEPIRERFANQQKAVRQKMDSWIDESGAEAPDALAVGESFDTAIRKLAARDKAEIRVAYQDAKKAGEFAAPVDTSPLVEFFAENKSGESVAPIIKAAKQELIRLKGAAEDEGGVLQAGELNLNDVQTLRRFLNKYAGADPSNVYAAGELKRVIDESTKDAGGAFYQKANALRAKFGDNFERHSVIADVLNNKRGTADRKVAIENVFDSIVFKNRSLADVKFAHNLLMKSGEEGVQAWKDIQGQTLRYIQDEAYKSGRRDSYNNTVISLDKLNKAITKLDTSGKLDFIVGSRKADQLRLLNSIAKDMFDAPVGTINTSGTAAKIMSAIDMMFSATTGIPVPLATVFKMGIKHSKDKAIKARIAAALKDPTKKD
jgi:hypothetical protein